VKSDTRLSVIVPVYNGGSQLERCLDALLASDFCDYEIIVVDDDSTDGSAAACRARGIEVFKMSARSGPAAARNHGVERARGNVILFIDADVVVRRDTLARVSERLDKQSGVAAVFGSYDDTPDAPNFFSQYKNLVHHFIHQQASAHAVTFWAGCGGVRREAFEAVGGFDESNYLRPSIEDIELGYRLLPAGFEIVLDKDIQVKHLKRWTFGSLIRTDIFNRALPWSRLILERGGMINDLNLRVSERVCVMLVGAAITLLLLSYFSIFLFAGTVGSLGLVFVLNLPLYRFFRRHRGTGFAMRSFIVHILYYLYSGIVFALSCCAHAGRKAFGFMPLIQRETQIGRVDNAK
jgi:GT2 family glycosyltransferase